MVCLFLIKMLMVTQNLLKTQKQRETCTMMPGLKNQISGMKKTKRQE